MAPKHHPTPLSGGDRKELGKARAMVNTLASQSVAMRAKGEALIQQADRLLCESWNERMWSDGEPIDPSPTIVFGTHSRSTVSRNTRRSRTRDQEKGCGLVCP